MFKLDWFSKFQPLDPKNLSTQGKKSVITNIEIYKWGFKVKIYHSSKTKKVFTTIEPAALTLGVLERVFDQSLPYILFRHGCNVNCIIIPRRSVVERRTRTLKNAALVVELREYLLSHKNRNMKSQIMAIRTCLITRTRSYLASQFVQLVS